VLRVQISEGTLSELCELSHELSNTNGLVFALLSSPAMKRGNSGEVISQAQQLSARASITLMRLMWLLGDMQILLAAEREAAACSQSKIPA